MANIIEARVKQKKDTLANWEANPMILLDGEQAFVVSDSGQPINFKIGDGTKRFSDLPWWIDYAGGQYVQVAGNALPTPTVELGYTFVGPGTYTFDGQPDVVAPDGRFSQLVWNGSSWSLKDMGALPVSPPTELTNEVSQQDEVAITPKGVEDNTVNVINGANKLLHAGVIVPKRIPGYILASTKVFTSSGVLFSRVWEIEPGSIDEIQIEGDFQHSSPNYYSEFSGDYNDPENFVKGLKITGSTVVNIDTVVKPHPTTRFILTTEYAPNNRVVTITRVKASSAYQNDAYKQLVIGVNKPIITPDYYVRSDGELTAHSLFNYKVWNIVKGSISAGKFLGSHQDSSVLWLSQFDGDILPENMVSFQKLPSSVLTPINGWYSFHPEATNIVVSWNDARPIELVDVRLSSNGGSSVAQSTIDYSQSVDMGAVNIQGVEDDSINAGVAAGQSTEANNTPSVGVTVNPIDGNLMLGNRVIMVANSTTDTVSPLIASESLGESPIVSAMNHFSTVYRRLRNPNTVFLANSVAVGSRSIEVLSKNATNTAWYEGGVNIYNSRYIPFLNGLKSYADGLGKKARLIFIKWGQGESNYSLQDTTMGLTTGTSQTRDKETYKALLLQYKNDAQADAMSILDQDKPPLFVIYQTGRQWNNEIEQQITMAQIEFAMENDDVVLMNPNYPVPGMRPTSDHYSENGARWHGELTGKALVQALIKGERPSVLRPMDVIVVDRSTIQVKYRVPVQPIVIDNNLTKPQYNSGFYVEVAGNQILINSVSVIGGDTIEIKLSSAMPNGLMKLSYAGSATEGKGNIRDSDTYSALYEYTDYTSISEASEEWVAKDQNNTPIYGKKIPLHNWANNLYYERVLS